MSSITTAAPGKLMLFGEHAVVYGRPCLVTAVNLRIHTTVQLHQEKWVEVHASTQPLPYRIALDDLQHVETFPKSVAFVLATVAQCAKRYGLQQGLIITTTGPAISYGLGSSSAVTAALTHALSMALGLNLTLKEQFELAYRAVLDVQGKGSGFDVASAIYGGTIEYQLGQRIEETRIEPLMVKEWPILIGYSGSKVSTVNYVNQVGELWQRFPQVTDQLFDTMAAIATAAKPALLTGDWERVGQLATLNQKLLDGLGVSTPELEALVQAANEHGAYGAKLSGAGGGDCMFAVVPTDRMERVRAAMQKVGQIVDLALDVPGVRVEKN